VAWLDRAAVSTATVSTDGIPIITRFTGANDAIAANNRRLANLARQACVQGRGRALAVRLKVASSVATVAGDQIVVVALLARIQNAVATRLVGRTFGSDAGVSLLLLTSRRASVARDGVSVVARFAKLREAVSTSGRGRRPLAQLAKARAGKAALYRTIRRATVAARVVSVIAAFIRSRKAVAAEENTLARLSGRRTNVTRLDLAGTVTAVAALGVSVVADFASFEDAIAAVGEHHIARIVPIHGAYDVRSLRASIEKDDGASAASASVAVAAGTCRHDIPIRRIAPTG
jgi:hypothetical protein